MATKRAFKRYIKDLDMQVTSAMPAAASTTVNGSALDLGALTAQGSRPPNLELISTIPALSTTILPNTRTMTITLQASDDSAFGSGVVDLASLVLTGAGGVGIADVSELRAPIGMNNLRYVRQKIVSGASTTDASALNAVLNLVA